MFRPQFTKFAIESSVMILVKSLKDMRISWWFEWIRRFQISQLLVEQIEHKLSLTTKFTMILDHQFTCRLLWSFVDMWTFIDVWTWICGDHRVFILCHRRLLSNCRSKTTHYHSVYWHTVLNQTVQKLWFRANSRWSAACWAYDFVTLNRIASVVSYLLVREKSDKNSFHLKL